MTETPPQTKRNPSWTRDELILALDTYLRHAGNPPGKSHPEILELSQTLSRIGRVINVTGDADYRNPNAVYMKLMNFRRFDPQFIAQGKVGLARGNKLEEEIWKEFAQDAQRCHQVAQSIRQSLEDDALDLKEQDEEGEEAEEGRVLTRVHRSRERNRKLVEKKKAQVLERQGFLACEACGFDFSKTYGERGHGFIECHHTRPVHTMQPGEKTRLQDLALLCSNCHRMVHIKRPWLTVEQLKNRIGGDDTGQQV